MAPDPGLLGKAVGARLRELELAIERYGRFVFSETAGEESPAPVRSPGEPGGPGVSPDGKAARELVLRAFRAAGDPAAYSWLARLSEADAPLAELAERAGVSMVVAWERLNDLIQAGLAARSLDGDRVGLTPAGQVVVEFVEEAVAAAGETP